MAHGRLATWPAHASDHVCPKLLQPLHWQRRLWPLCHGCQLIEAASLFDLPQQGHQDSNTSSARCNALARDLAAAGTVLLLNRGVLPLPATLTSILLMGTAVHDAPYCCGSGSGGLSPH